MLASCRPLQEARIMNRTIRITGCIALLSLAGTGYACDYPTSVSVPNGMSATKDEMIVGQKDVKTFVASMETYLECIVEEEKLARLAMEDLAPEVEQTREDKLNQKYNAAVEDMEKVAAQFNTEVQAYKARED